MKSKLFLIFVFMACFVPMFSQDIIMKTDGNEIQAKVTEVNADEVRYRAFKNLTGPVFVIAGADIFMIKYENGSKDIFENTPGGIQIQHVESDPDNTVVNSSVVVDNSQTGVGVGKVEETRPPVAAQNPVAVQNLESPYSAGGADDNNFQPVGNYAILHFYRSSAMGMVVKYDMYLNDIFMFKVSNKWCETAHVSQFGANMLWAKTESRTEMPINIEPGREYYVRCGVKMGVGIGRPKFEIVDNKTGEKEYQAIAKKKGQSENPIVIPNPSAGQNRVTVQNPVAPVAVQTPVVQTPVAVEPPAVQTPAVAQNLGSAEPAGTSQGLTPIQDEATKKYGYVDKQGKIVVSYKYDGAGKFSFGFATVNIGREYGVIDSIGKEVAPLIYSGIVHNNNGNGFFGFLNGKEIHYDNRGRKIEGLEMVTTSSLAAQEKSNETKNSGSEQKLTPKQDETTKKWGYVDESGRETVPCIYDKVFIFTDEGYAIVQLKPKGLGIIDKTGREVIPCKYQNIYTSIHRDGAEKITKIIIFFDNLLIVQSNYKWGYIDITGRELIPCIYQVALDFSENLAAVMLNDKWGFIDKSGQEAIPFIYDAIWSGFSNGKAKVMLNSKNFYIDKAGNTVK